MKKFLADLVKWFIDNRKPVITYAVYACFLVSFVKTSILAKDLQPLDTGWALFLCLLLGIDMTHESFENLQNRKFTK